MINLVGKQKIRKSYEQKLYLIAELQKMGNIKMRDGRSFEECTLYSIQHEHAREQDNNNRYRGDSNDSALDDRAQVRKR